MQNIQEPINMKKVEQGMTTVSDEIPQKKDELDCSVRLN
jgi:hypothetical protein